MTHADIAVRIREILLEAGITDAEVRITYTPPVAVKQFNVSIRAGGNIEVHP